MLCNFAPQKQNMCSGPQVYFKYLNCFKWYQLSVVHVKLAFCEFVVAIYKITLFPIKLAIFFFPSEDLQYLRFPTTLARLGKAYCVQPGSGASCNLDLVLQGGKKVHIESFNRFYKATSLYRIFQSISFRLPASSAPWWLVQ